MYTKIEGIAQAIFNNQVTRQTLPGWHAAQITQIGYSRELKYHPTIYKGDEIRNLVTINNSDYEQTDEFRRLQESRRKGDNDSRLYWRDEKKLFTDEDKRRLGDIFRRQIDTAGDSAGISDGILNAGDKADTSYTIRKNVSGKLFHDIFEIVRSYLPNGELVDLHD